MWIRLFPISAVQSNPIIGYLIKIQNLKASKLRKQRNATANNTVESQFYKFWVNQTPTKPLKVIPLKMMFM